jgi:prepilin-type processing-associated H-X9-DG protein
MTSKHGCYSHDLFYDYEYDSPNCVNVAFVDGHVTTISTPIPEGGTSGLLKIGGVSDESLDYQLPNREDHCKATLRWRFCLKLAIWIICVMLLFRQAIRARKRRYTGNETVCSAP